MTQDERIVFYASLCEQLYNPKSSLERERAQQWLEYSFPTFGETPGKAGMSSPPGGFENSPSFAIVTPTDTASALRALLENSPNPYVQTFCLSRLKQLIQAQFTVFSSDIKLQLRKSTKNKGGNFYMEFVVPTNALPLWYHTSGAFLFQYSFMHPDLQPFVITLLAGVLGLLTRLGWNDIEEYRNVQQDIQQFLQTSALRPRHAIPPNSEKQATTSFRDTQLYTIFEDAFKALTALLRRTISFEKPGQEERIKEATINVLLKCLSYDFAGTTMDEAGEDIGMVQIPASWRHVFEDESFVPTLFTAYGEFPPPISARVMECLVLVASVRRGLFDGDPERSKFVISIMQGIRDIIVTSQGMNDMDNYNEFCRLLYRFRATAPLNEMAEKPGYVEWIEVIADFTLKAVQSWKWAPNTATYLLGFWSRIVQSITYYRQLSEITVKKLENISVELTRIYITTNVDSVAARIDEMLDDPLENEETLVENLGMLGQIARCKYVESSGALESILDPIALQFQELVSQASSAGITAEETVKTMIEVYQTKFAWLIYIAAVFIGSRPAYMSSEESDAIDGKLTCKVFQLIEVNQALQNQFGVASLNQKFDMAILYFFMQFRKAYIGETTGKAMYTKLSEAFGVGDQNMVLNVIMTKMYVSYEVKTLELFSELASGALRNLRKIETIQLMLQDHMSRDFVFFENEKHQQNRMAYYQVLCKILFADDQCERDFYMFMRPFESRLASIETLDSVEAFRQPAVRLALLNTFRDLRGFLQPIQSRRDFMLFFEWFYPDYMPVLLRALEAWAPDPSVNVLLKFFAELVYNKVQRLNFDVSSPNGILLFRDTSRVLTIYGRRILEYQVLNENDKYPLKYKGISICFQILSRCLVGRYINFGVFWLYQDKAIDEAFQMMFQLMVHVPLEDLMRFPKLGRSFMGMLDEFCKEQLTSLTAALEPNTFLYMMRACEQGVESTDNYVRSHACSTIDTIATFFVRESQKATDQDGQRRRMRKAVPATHWLMSYLGQYPSLLPSLFVSIFNLILFDGENQDRWALAKPLYILMLLQKDYAIEYTGLVIQQQLPERREFVAKSFSMLTEGIEWTLASKDRERFTQNINQFHREMLVNQVTLVPISLVSQHVQGPYATAINTTNPAVAAY
ncbi:hypothetical protein BX666DRAFT_2032239 [Dichotomocladium elegans]|nr:hypothetical protein BX666DRAFT_2032239 [Dichotomocladium elegans]